MFVIDNEKYLRRFWEILEYLKPYEARFEKLIFVIESISDFIVEKNIQLEERIIKSIEYITKEYIYDYLLRGFKSLTILIHFQHSGMHKRFKIKR